MVGVMRDGEGFPMGQSGTCGLDMVRFVLMLVHEGGSPTLNGIQKFAMVHGTPPTLTVCVHDFMMLVQSKLSYRHFFQKKPMAASIMPVKIQVLKVC